MQKAARALQTQITTYRELIADDENEIRLATNAKIFTPFHFLKNGVLHAPVVVDERLLPQTPKQWIPLERQGPWFLEPVIIEEHGVHARHHQQMPAVHDVLLGNRVGPGYPQLRATRIDIVSRQTGIEPIAPYITQQEFMDHLAEQSLERAPCRGQTVEVSEADGVGHATDLVPVGVKKFLLTLEAGHVMPFSVDLRGQVVEVTEMPGLVGSEFRISRDVERQTVARLLLHNLRATLEKPIWLTMDPVVTKISFLLFPILSYPFSETNNKEKKEGKKNK